MTKYSRSETLFIQTNPDNLTVEQIAKTLGRKVKNVESKIAELDKTSTADQIHTQQRLFVQRLFSMAMTAPDIKEVSCACMEVVNDYIIDAYRNHPVQDEKVPLKVGREAYIYENLSESEQVIYKQIKTKP